MARCWRLPLVLLAAAGCGGTPARGTNVRETRSEAPTEPVRPSTVTTVKEEPKLEPFHATSGPGDAPVPFVRDERSSRLDVGLPRGRPREEWRAPLAPPLRPSFVLAAGNRVAVVGDGTWALFDDGGHRLDAGAMTNPRLDRVSGLVVPDETRSADVPADAKIAMKGGLSVMVKEGSVHVGEREIEGRFDALDLAVDDTGLACVVVRQAGDWMLWTVPLGNSSGIGRQRIPGHARRVIGPPVLGKSLRVLVLDTGLVALGLDGKRVWERRGLPSGGISITADDHVLVADEGKVLAIDPKGRTSELLALPGVVFVTPPILDARGTLFVASGQALHAFSFS